MEGGGSDGGRGADNREGLLHERERDDDEISPRACSVAASPLYVASPYMGSVASMAASASLFVGVGTRDREGERGGGNGDAGRDSGRSSSIRHNRWRSLAYACCVSMPVGACLISSLHRNGSLLGVVKRCSAFLFMPVMS